MTKPQYEFKAKLSGIHIIAGCCILFFIMPHIFMPVISAFGSSEPAAVAGLIIWSLVALALTVFFSWLIYCSMNRRIIISREKLVISTPFRTREILWRNIADVIHLTQKVNGITTAKVYQFKDYRSKTVFTMPEKGQKRFSGDGDIVEILFMMYEQRDRNPAQQPIKSEHGAITVPGGQIDPETQLAPGAQTIPGTRTNPPAPASSPPGEDGLNRENLWQDAVFECNKAVKVILAVLSTLFLGSLATGLAASLMSDSGKQEYGPAVLGLAFIILCSYLVLVNITSRVMITSSTIKYGSLFSREKTIEIASISNLLERNLYMFNSIVLYLKNGDEIHLRGIRLYKMSRITQMISMRMQVLVEKRENPINVPLPVENLQTNAPMPGRLGNIWTAD